MIVFNKLVQQYDMIRLFMFSNRATKSNLILTFK